MERRFPLLREGVHGRSGETIPWSVGRKAWEAYHRRFPEQSCERIAERGGFAPSEMDEWYPGWREVVT